MQNMEKKESRDEQEKLVKAPLSSVAKSKKKKRSKKKNLESPLKNPPLMAKKTTKPVVQPLGEEELMEEEEGEKEELVKPPSSSPAVSAAGKQDADCVVAKSKKEEGQSSSAAEVSPKTEKEKKRHMEEGSTRDEDAKRVKTEEKKTNFKRLWSQADEIVLLQAIIDFEMDPFKEKIRFQESVEKSSISIEFTDDQLMGKIRNLQRKFKSKENKVLLTFSNPHDRTCFEMSQKIWGSKVEVEEEEKEEEEEEEEDRKNVMLVNGENDWFDKSFLVGKIASFGLREEAVKENWKLVPIQRKRELEEKFRLLEKERTMFSLRQIALVNDAASALAETS